MERELLEKDVIHGNFTSSRYQNGSDMQWGHDTSLEYPSRSEFGKTLFIVYNGVLRQFRIKEVVVFPFNWGIKRRDSMSLFNNVTILEVAGIGILNVGLYMYGGEFNCPIYASVEDYKNGKEYKMSYTRVKKENCEKRFGIKFVTLGILREDYLRRWYWNGTSSYLGEIQESMPICYLVTKDGIELPDGWSPEELSGYATKEECEDDNSINICCFDEEESPKKFTIKAEAVFTRRVEVEANSYKEAVEKAKAELKANPWEEGDNNGTQFN